MNITKKKRYRGIKKKNYKKMVSKLYKLIQAQNRASAVSQGFYDGRFKTRTIPDKKKIVHIKMRKNKNFNMEFK